MSDSTTFYLLFFFGLCLAFWIIEVALRCVVWVQDRRLRAQLEFARRQPSVASASPTRPHSGHGPVRPAGMLNFQIEQGKILHPQPNGANGKTTHHQRN